MAFWKFAYNAKCVTIDQLRIVVKTESNPYGEITSEEFEQITGKAYAE
ncbi:XkdX family protein [Sporosarcina sp. FSL K6-1522]